jgi:hypothetical protein
LLKCSAYDPAVGITCTAVTRTVTIEGYDDIDLMQPIVVNVLAVSNPGASIDGISYFMMRLFLRGYFYNPNIRFLGWSS